MSIVAVTLPADGTGSTNEPRPGVIVSGAAHSSVAAKAAGPEIKPTSVLFSETSGSGPLASRASRSVMPAMSGTLTTPLWKTWPSSAIEALATPPSTLTVMSARPSAAAGGARLGDAEVRAYRIPQAIELAARQRYGSRGALRRTLLGDGRCDGEHAHAISNKRIFRISHLPRLDYLRFRLWPIAHRPSPIAPCPSPIAHRHGPVTAAPFACMRIRLWARRPSAVSPTPSKSVAPNSGTRTPTGRIPGNRAP